jgi:lipid A 3-O-deacylase
MKLRLIFFLLLFNISFHETLTGQVYKVDEYGKSFTLQFDNDTYYLTDYYYTYGLKLGVNQPVFGEVPWNKIFIKTHNPSIISGLDITQKLYTPKNIRDTLIQFNDRPFAATLELAQTNISTDSIKGLIIQSTLRLGIMGPAAGGELLQKKIHEWIISPDPGGWKYQIQNALILNYDIGISKPLFNNDIVRLSGDGILRIGTLNNDIEAGINLTIKSNPKKKFGVWIQLYGGSRFIAYNATLQGSFFNDDSYTLNWEEITPVIIIANGEIGMRFRGINLSFTHYYLSKEFDNGISHYYGSFRLVIQF